jgi:hypothetical protein
MTLHSESAWVVWLCCLALPMLGWVNFLIPAIGALGSILGGASRGASAGRQQTTQNNAVQDTQRTSQYGINQVALTAALKAAEDANMNRGLLDLKRRDFSLDAPTTRMKQAAAGSRMANTQDMTVSHPRARTGSISGGPKPSDLTPEARQLGALIARQSLMNQMKGDTFEDVPQQDWQSGVLQAPGVTGLPQAGGFEKFGATMGLVGGGLEEIMRRIQQQSEGGGGGGVPRSGGGVGGVE